MKHKIIEQYLNDVLMSQLVALDVSSKFIKTVTNTISTQIYSCVYCWIDEQFRKGLLTIGAEEGLFYEPHADNDIRNFVVVTIRNSEIEWLQTDNYVLTGIKSRYDDSYVKQITSEAINYFKNVDFSALSDELKEPAVNVYGILAEQYPAAFLALMAIGTVDKQFFGYQKAKQAEIPDISILPLERNVISQQEKGIRSNYTHAMADGIAFSIDQPLLDILKQSVDNKAPFISDSFKSVSRNMNKLLLIMEYVLRSNTPFVTSNYFITDHYIERRKKIVRAGHNREEMLRNWKNSDGLCKNHEYSLKIASDGLG